MFSKVIMLLIFKCVIYNRSEYESNLQSPPVFSVTHDFKANYSKKTKLETNKLPFNYERGESKPHISDS